MVVVVLNLTAVQPRMAMTTSRDGTNSEDHRDATTALDCDIRAMSGEDGSGVRMCHEQGRTAVYLSSDERFIIEHEPNGTTRKLHYRTEHDKSQPAGATEGPEKH